MTVAEIFDNFWQGNFPPLFATCFWKTSNEIALFTQSHWAKCKTCSSELTCCFEWKATAAWVTSVQIWLTQCHLRVRAPEVSHQAAVHQGHDSTCQPTTASWIFQTLVVGPNPFLSQAIYLAVVTRFWWPVELATNVNLALQRLETCAALCVKESLKRKHEITSCGEKNWNWILVVQRCLFKTCDNNSQPFWWSHIATCTNLPHVRAENLNKISHVQRATQSASTSARFCRWRSWRLNYPGSRDPLLTSKLQKRVEQSCSCEIMLSCNCSFLTSPFCVDWCAAIVNGVQAVLFPRHRANSRVHDQSQMSENVIDKTPLHTRPNFTTKTFCCLGLILQKFQYLVFE